MKEKHKKHAGGKTTAGKTALSQNDLIAGASTFALPGPPAAAPGSPFSKQHSAEHPAKPERTI